MQKKRFFKGSLKCYIYKNNSYINSFKYSGNIYQYNPEIIQKNYSF